ncbi:MAG: putative UDP-N-acetylglucosamine--dolichyl-phosphate N-acetylglucosaminephosphotransferase [Streblomastix strix]|uniref:UDP-N-acetylglucosamine--dolichyl-phosphate N-acetylglucosaminephosphotransferase n=1 Tax=Streblomastix strix TaxID=222440 RepID=A0A5J4WYS1_9EUKA|nr:MAG: putative UDP-N-acetylglucosamine--dolichyl-phosphate N-acetylglucosaminephosphotransferase [Streblomastix strix]
MEVGTPEADIIKQPAILYLGFLAVSLLSYIYSRFLIKRSMKSFDKAGLFGIDINKEKPKTGDPPHVPEGLGLIVGIVFLLLLLVLSLCAHLIKNIELSEKLKITFIISLSLLILGFADDVLNIRWRYKIYITVLCSLPVAELYINNSNINIPNIRFLRYIFRGNEQIDLGFIYVAYVCAILVFCTHSINIYAGINGLEVGQSIVIGNSDADWNFAFICSILFVSVCFALWHFNKFPSRVFVGDSFTLWSGASLAAIGIVGHFPSILLLLFFPQIANFVLSLPQLFHMYVPLSVKMRLPLPFRDCPRHRVPKINIQTGKLQASPNLTLLNAALYIFGPMTEKDLTTFLVIFQTIIDSIFIVLALVGIIPL